MCTLTRNVVPCSSHAHSTTVIGHFNSLTTEKQRDTWVPVMQLLLNGLNKLDKEKV